MNRSCVVALVFVVLAAGGCGGGGGSHHHVSTVGSLVVSWSYDLFEVAQALNSFGPCSGGVTDFWIEIYDGAGVLVDVVWIDQPFGAFEILGVGYLQGFATFAGLPPDNYEVRFVSGTLLAEDIELYCGPFVPLFTLDLPSSYFVDVLPGLETHVIDVYVPDFVGVL